MKLNNEPPSILKQKWMDPPYQRTGPAERTNFEEAEKVSKMEREQIQDQEMQLLIQEVELER